MAAFADELEADGLNVQRLEATDPNPAALIAAALPAVATEFTFRLDSDTVIGDAAAAAVAAAGSAAADCGDDVHTGLLRDGRVDFRALAVHIHVNMAAKQGSGLAQTVANPRPLALEAVDHVADSRRLHVELPRQAGEQWCQGRRKADVRHYSVAATSTDEIGGR